MTSENHEHPMQPLIKDPEGVIRFRKNMIVRFLLDNGPWDLNKLAQMPFSNEDRQQFAQLIGYSLSGYGELPYVDDEAYERAEVARGVSKSPPRCRRRGTLKTKDEGKID
jgi:hypothetical protein